MSKAVHRVRRFATESREKGARRHKPDYSIIVYTALLVMIGLVIIFAIGPQRANVLNEVGEGNFSDSHFIIKQSLGVFVAVAAFFGAAFLKVDTILRYKNWILLAGIISGVLLYLLGNLLHVEQVTQCALGACRWFVVPGIGTFQPAELLKFGVLIFTAGFLAYRYKKGLVNNIDKTILPLIGLLAVCSFLVIFLQRDLGTGVALAVIMVAMGIISGIDTRIGVKILLILLVAGVLMIMVAPHRLDRLATFLHGDETSTSDSSSYHITHAKIAIGSGGLFGVGIGNSVQAAGYLPEAINDSVFAILGETFGFVGLVVILFLFYALLRRILFIVDRSQNPNYRFLAAGVFGWISSHVTINIAAMIGLIPLTGITLPFLSFGGTSMLFIAAALGFVFQISQYTVHKSEIKEVKDESLSSRRRIGRTRYAGRRSNK